METWTGRYCEAMTMVVVVVVMMMMMMMMMMVLVQNPSTSCKIRQDML